MLKRMLALAALLMLAAPALSANVVVPAEFRDIVNESARIVRGRVTDVRAIDVPGRGIESVLTVAISSTVKGTVEPFVYVRVPGGEIGRNRFVMVGAPTFTVGEHAVFFLKPEATGGWRPVGLSMGVYRVHPDAATGQPVVPSPIVARVTTSPRRISRGDLRRGSMPVLEFESLVQLVMQGRVAVPRSGGSR